jgi:hypothetical protein
MILINLVIVVVLDWSPNSPNALPDHPHRTPLSI